MNPNLNFSKLEIEEKLYPLLEKNTKPHGNKRYATKAQEDIILKYCNKKGGRLGVNRMWMYVKRQ